MLRPALVAIAVLFALSPAATSAQAEPQKPDVEAVIASAEYKDLVREGMLKYTRGVYAEARDYFLKAHELAPNARTLRGLALVSYDWRHFVEAIDYAEQSLTHPVQPPNDKMKEELSRLIEQAQSQVAHAELVTTPANAELRVDRVPVSRRADGTVWLDPGEHELLVSAPGYFEQSQRLQLGEQQRARLEITLRSHSAAEPAHIAAPAAKPSSDDRSALPWVVVGVSAGVAVVGGVMLAVDQAGRGEGSSSAFTPLGAALLGVGAVGVIVGVTWSLTPRADAERSASARLRVSPLSIQCSGTF